MSEPTKASDSILDGRDVIMDHLVKSMEKISLPNGETDEKPHRNSDLVKKCRLVPLHQRPDLLIPCAELINSEWQRSLGARVHSLQKSNSQFPVCLILLEYSNETERLIGHVRLVPVIGHNRSLFMESVVVSKEERGKGYGRILMEEVERYAKRRGFQRLCLTTQDKQHFYAHIGYELSTPVQSSGPVMANVPMKMLLRLSRSPSEEMNSQKEVFTKMEVQPSQERTMSFSPLPSPTSVSPPPPPPPPPLSIPPPPPCPSSPCPPMSANQFTPQTMMNTPYRDAKDLPIFWMHKNI